MASVPLNKRKLFVACDNKQLIVANYYDGGHKRRPNSVASFCVALLFFSLSAICWSQSELTQQRRQLESSELSFEFLNLRLLPGSRELCAIEAQNLNVVSFANNRIEKIDAESFVCIGTHLKILNLSNNRIFLISSMAFVGLDQLQVLLLDGNQIATVPSIALNSLVTLRHLNLANNLIETIGITNTSESSSKANDLDKSEQQTVELYLPNLISLNLRSNPIRTIERQAFKRLPSLKTLTLARINLSSWHAIWPLFGLAELRFLHLERAIGIRSGRSSNQTVRQLEFGCSHASQLTTLSLRSNELDQVPSFEASCKGMQSIDLSYNRIGGQLDGGPFRHLGALLDLYLGHNFIESIGEHAFAGLDRLQVLDLQANRLVLVHARALISRTLLELNIAENEHLTEFQLPDDNQIRILWAYSNPALRRLPYLKRAQRLSLTYAYHCCDYVHQNDDAHDKSAHADNGQPSYLAMEATTTTRGAAMRHKQQQQKSVSDALAHWTRALFASLFGSNLNSPSASNASTTTTGTRITDGLGHHQQQQQQQDEEEDDGDEDDDHEWRSVVRASSLGELVVWPTSGANTKHHRNGTHYGDERDANNETETNVIDGQASKSNGKRNYISSEQKYDLHHHGRHRLSSALASGKRFKRSKERENLQQQQRNELNELKCAPQPNAFMPCQEMFDSWWLRMGVWLVFACALAGNLLVIIVLGSARQNSSSSALANLMWLAGHSKRHIDVPRFLVLNLAFADLLMAIYLGLLATVDLQTLGDFRQHAIRWQHSAGCKLAAFLAVLSSELSVFVLAIITLERNYAITNAVHLNRRLSLHKAMLIMLLGYTFALAMALGPLYGLSDYRKFSVCLPLDFETNSWARAYIMTLITINSFSFALLLGCYLRMYCAIRGSQAWNTNDLKIARRMSVLILTDFLCWMPIILVACFALAGHNLVGPRGLKVLTIFILPLNSVANPFLYAITTKKFKRDLLALRRRLAKLTGAKRQNHDQHQQHQHNNNNNHHHHHHQQQQHHHRLHHRRYHNAGHDAVNHRHHQCDWAAADETRAEMAEAVGFGPHSHLAALDSSLRCHRGGAGDYHELQYQNNQNSTGANKLANRGSRRQTRLIASSRRQQILATSNKTSACCSCGRIVAASGTSSKATSIVAKHQVAVQVKMSASESASNSSLLVDGVEKLNEQSSAPIEHPKIVLDSVCEPMLDARPLAMSRDLDAQSATDTQLALQTYASAQSEPSKHSDKDDVAVSLDLRTNSLQSRLGADSNVQVASSIEFTANEADVAARQQQQQQRQQLLQRTTRGHTGAIDGKQHLSSCQIIEWHDDGENNKQLLYTKQQQATAGDRCASACSYRWPVNNGQQTSWRASQREEDSCGDHVMRARKSHSPATHSEDVKDMCSGGSNNNSSSNDNNNNNNKLSRSISRLLFGPIARAWSSIQSISLHSVAPVSSATAIARQQTLKSQRASSVEPNETTTTTSGEHCITCKRRLNNNNNNIDDILLLNSPSSSKRMLRSNQKRRMSRSCDQLTTSNNTTYMTLLAEQSTTSATLESHMLAAGGEPTIDCHPSSHSTSQSNGGDDDRRILLATINRLADSSAGHGIGHGRVISRLVATNAAQNQGFSGQAKLKCGARCRSWSPALLAKLEDCMHQIKEKLRTTGSTTMEHDEPGHCDTCCQHKFVQDLTKSSSSSSFDRNDQSMLTTTKPCMYDDDAESRENAKSGMCSQCNEHGNMLDEMTERHHSRCRAQIDPPAATLNSSPDDLQQEINITSEINPLKTVDLTTSTLANLMDSDTSHIKNSENSTTEKTAKDGKTKLQQSQDKYERK